MQSDLTDHLNSLQRFALLLTRNPDWAEALVQQMLVRAMEGVRTSQPGRDLRKWLFAILHNVHVSRCRRKRVEAMPPRRSAIGRRRPRRCSSPWKG